MAESKNPTYYVLVKLEDKADDLPNLTRAIDNGNYEASEPHFLVVMDVFQNRVAKLFTEMEQY